MKRILIASSSVQFLKRNTALLNGRGLEVFSARRGQDALKIHEEHPVDLILSDVLLEDMDGIKLCTLINKERRLRHIPFILCTLGHSGSSEKVKQDRAITLLVKPIDPVQLLETVSKLFDVQIARSKRVALQVTVLNKKFGLELICHSHDISNTGILVESEHPFKIGDQIVCQFTLPNACHIETAGEVIRSVDTSYQKNFYGIKFIDIPLSQFKAIDEYVSSRPQLLKSHKDPNHRE